MKKKLVSILLSAALTGSLLAGCGGADNNTAAPAEGGTEAQADGGAAEDATSGEVAADDAAAESGSKDGAYDLTLYTINSTDEDFPDWLANVEGATGLKINVIAAPTDSDTRQQKITTILSTGDASVDILEINDEMSASFKNSGWLEGLNDTVMTEDIRGEFPQGYVADMITDKNGQIIGVPGYSGYLAFWVNQQILDEAGITSMDTKEDFVKYLEAASGDGRYGYGGSWV